MKPIVIIQNMGDDPAGMLSELLEEYAIPYDVINVEHDVIPASQNYGAIIALGGAQNANEDDKYPYLAKEKAFILQAVKQEIPFLGICLGGQLLASALGALVNRHTITEIGFSDVQLTSEGKNDPLYARLPDAQCVYQWHEDTFTIPQRGVLLATNTQTKNQAFRAGKNAYGLQYHIELTPAMLDMWLHYPSLRQEIIGTIGQDAYEQLEHDSISQYPRYREHSRLLIENFLAIAHYRNCR